MTRYTDDSRERVRDAVDMLRLVEDKIGELRRAGVNSYFGLCPFHDERTPSFHVRPDEKHYNCFGCSEAGDPFKFVMETEGVDFKGALELLADKFGVALETVDEDPEAAARRQRRERLYSLTARTATFFERMLWESREGAPAREYLVAERGLSEDVLRRFRVGWAPRAWDKVLTGSRKAGFSEEELLDAGLIQQSRKDPSKRFDRFRSQIMFPTADARGRVIGFGARKLPGDEREWLGKYVNTAEGELYSKRKVLYGIQEARGPAAKAGRMVLAEGYTDVLALHQAGVANAVGIMGTSLTKEQVSELVRLVRVLELCLDADNAGQEAIARAAGLCADSGLELRVVDLPVGADPGELVKTDPEALRGRVASSVPYVAFEVERVLGSADLDSAEGKDRAIAALAPAFARVPESVLRDELLRRASGALGIAEGRLVSLLGRTEAPRAAPVVAPEAPRVVDPGVKTEREYLAMCLAAGEPGRAELESLDPERLLSSALLRRAVRRLTGQAELDGEDGEVSAVIDELESRAAAAARSGRVVTVDHLEHARELLELARLERDIQAARAEGHGIAGLAAEREQARQRIAAVVGRLESG
ncbi:MAG: DNA primase [Solirubrobacterales bacterium]|nr:DNA primase [Solirubrobacterales bacterium]